MTQDTNNKPLCPKLAANFTRNSLSRTHCRSILSTTRCQNTFSNTLSFLIIFFPFYSYLQTHLLTMKSPHHYLRSNQIFLLLLFLKLGSNSLRFQLERHQAPSFYPLVLPLSQPPATRCLYLSQTG